MIATGDKQQAAETRPGQRLEELASIISAYNSVTDKLQQSHEQLRGEVVRLQRELASADAQLQRSKRLAALGEMAAGIAHEIRNPLGGIGLYTRMLIQDLEELKGCGQPITPSLDAAHKIASAVRGLNAIVGDVLSFARELSPALRPTPVGELFERVIETQQPMFEAAGVTVVRNDKNNPQLDGLQVMVDSDLMHQALLNLVRNSVQAMAGEEPETWGGRGEVGKLTLTARREDDQLILGLRDTGPGIEQQDIDRLFNPFFTTRSTGTGLGLAIVHRIVDAHGGAICVHNDGGAVFEVSLPLRSTDS